MTDEEFYAECARLFGLDFTYNKPVRRTRWSARGPGNGRYEGRGLIRCYGSTIYVNLHNPYLIATYSDKDAALAAIRNLLDTQA